MEEQQLMEYFKFDASDLNANRNGTLTEKQKTRLNAELREARKSRTRWAYFLFFLAAIGIAIALGIWFIPDLGLGMRIGFGIGFGLVWPALYGLVGFALLPPASYTDLDLASQTGRVNIVRVESRDPDTRAVSSRYDLYIGPRRFLVDSNIGHVLIQGDEYTIYYLKNSNKIVSAEFISRAK